MRLAVPLVVSPERVDAVEPATGVGAVRHFMRPRDAADAVVALERRDLGLRRLDDEASERREVADVVRVRVGRADGVAVVLCAELDDVLGTCLGVGRGGVVE